MKQKYLYFNFTLLLILMFLLFAIFNLSGQDKSIEIVKIGWLLENIDCSFWTNSEDKTCFYNFWIYYEGADIDISDIEYAVIYFEKDRCWTITIDENTLNKKRKKIGKWYRFWADDYYYNGSVLPIGTLRFVVKLINGNIAEYDFSIPAPNSASTDGYGYVYTEEYEGTIFSNYTPMIKRAININASKNETNKTVSIIFKAKDKRIYNGWIWFYNNDDDYVGEPKDKFRDFKTGTLSKIINNGEYFHTNGKKNNVLVNEGEIGYKENYNFSDISKVIIILTDGFQYEHKDSTYDCRSISETILLTIEK